MAKLTKKQQTEIKFLAVAYDAFNEAIDKHDNLGICVWGKSLINYMGALGFDPFDRDRITHTIEWAKSKASEKNARTALSAYDAAHALPTPAYEGR